MNNITLSKNTGNARLSKILWEYLFYMTF